MEGEWGVAGSRPTTGGLAAMAPPPGGHARARLTRGEEGGVCFWLLLFGVGGDVGGS